MKFNLDDAFLICGNKHIYQKIILIAILFTWLSVDFISLVFPLLEIEPKFECQIGDSFSTCTQEHACSLDSQLVKRIVTFHNILTDYNLDCKKFDTILLGISYTVGILIGSFFASISSDIIGRKPVLLISQIIFLLSNILLLYARSYYFVLTALFTCGIACSGGTMISFLYINEILSKGRRSIYGVLINIFFSIAGLLYFFCFQNLRNWVYLVYICMTCDIISIIMVSLYCVESPRFPYSSKNYCKSLKLLYEISIKNNKKHEFEKFIKDNYINYIQGKELNNSNSDDSFKNSLTNSFEKGKNESGVDVVINYNINYNENINNDIFAVKSFDKFDIFKENENFNKNNNENLNLHESTSNEKQAILIDNLKIEEIFDFLTKIENDLINYEKINLNDNCQDNKIDDINQSNIKIHQKINFEKETDNKEKQYISDRQSNFVKNLRYRLNHKEEKKESFLNNKFKENILIKKNIDEFNCENDNFVNQESGKGFTSEEDLSFYEKLGKKDTQDTLQNSNKNFDFNYKNRYKKQSSYFSLIRYKSIRYKFLICNLVWFTYAFTYYGISFYLKKGGDEVFLDGYIIYTAEIISLIITFFIMSSSFFGRVKTINMMMILAGISTMSYYYMKNQSVDYYDKIPLFLARFSITSINSVMYTYSTEFYPTIIRAKGLGINIFCARVACCFVPILIDIIDNPFIIFSFLCLFTSIFTFFLNETLNKDLEDDILEERIQ